MSETKTCSITEDEIEALIQSHAKYISDYGLDDDYRIERINYLNRRLKAEKKEAEIKAETQVDKMSPSVSSNNIKDGW